jgi:hypothetical protein
MSGGGLYSLCINLNVTILNSILWNNTAVTGHEIALGDSCPTSATLSYCDVQGGQAEVHVGPGSTLSWGNGSIDQDPLFMGDEDFHIATGSPCIDSGMATEIPEDLDGDFRPLLSGFDMGADEYSSPCWDLDEDNYPDQACGGSDCNDTNPEVHPGRAEIPGNGTDDDCDPATPAYPEPANTLAAFYGKSSLLGSGMVNELVLFFLPAGAVLILKRLRSRKQEAAFRSSNDIRPAARRA